MAKLKTIGAYIENSGIDIAWVGFGLSTVKQILIYSLLTAKCIDLSLLIDYSTHFKEVIQYYHCQFSPASA